MITGLGFGLEDTGLGLGLEDYWPWPWPRTCCPRTHPWFDIWKLDISSGRPEVFPRDREFYVDLQILYHSHTSTRDELLTYWKLIEIE